MKLPRLLFIRIRRKLQRQFVMHPAMNLRVRYEQIGTLPVTKRKHPEGKPWLRYLALLALGCVLTWAFTGCATTSTTVRAPDGTVTTVEESKPAIKDDTKQFAADVFWAFAPRQRPAREEETAVKPEKAKTKPRPKPIDPSK